MEESNEYKTLATAVQTNNYFSRTPSPVLQLSQAAPHSTAPMAHKLLNRDLAFQLK
ncbi:conserved hypothetical protein [Ricinus communis]|uniref:Uncharacterized protein n=1 Tax=Ricinus communis TaxID=3988 RepID=B9RUB4_RICCO|nr:conserved hypothetical protein [Ricinus communis]